MTEWKSKQEERREQEKEQERHLRLVLLTMAALGATAFVLAALLEHPR
jgi:hypothetical protein